MAYDDLRAFAANVVESITDDTIRLDNTTGLEAGDRVIVDSGHGYGETGLDGNWDFAPTTKWGYYSDAPVGKAWHGTALAVDQSSKIVTLDRTINAACVGRVLHRNNADAVKKWMDQRLPWPSGQLLACSFLVNDRCTPIRCYTGNDPYTYDFGGCTLYAPRGAGMLCLHLQHTYPPGGPVSNKTYRNLTIKGNWGLAGYGFLTEGGQAGVAPALNCSGDGSANAHNTRVENCKFFENAWSFSMRLTQDAWIEDCEATLSEPFMRYIAWHMQAATCKRVTFLRCKVRGVRPAQTQEHVAGFEAFEGDDICFKDCETTDAIWAANSVGDVSFIRPKVISTAQELDPSVPNNNGAGAYIGVNRTIEKQQGKAKAWGTVTFEDVDFQCTNVPFPNHQYQIPCVVRIGSLTQHQTQPIPAILRRGNYSVPQTGLNMGENGFLFNVNGGTTTIDGQPTGDVIDGRDAIHLINQE